MMSRFFFWVALLCLVLPSLSSPAKSYKSHLKQWTKGRELYQRHDLYASLKWHATLQSEELLRAQAKKIASIYKGSRPIDAHAKTYPVNSDADRVVFFVSLYTYDRKHSDLNNPQNSWALEMQWQDQVLQPLKVEQLSDLTPLQQKLYPYIDLWSRYYLVSFQRPKGFSTKGVALKLRGPAGQDTLIWE